MNRLRISLLALALAAATLGAGCGGETTDVSQGVEKLNSDVLKPLNAELDCPDEVDGGEGTTFDCTLKSTKGDQSAKLKMKIVKQDGDLAVDVADSKQYDAALKKVASQ